MTTWNEVLLADIVIIPLTFLQNKAYLDYSSALGEYHPSGGGLDERIIQMKRRGRNNFG
jgi:hypothetical protein